MTDDQIQSEGFDRLRESAFCTVIPSRPLRSSRRLSSGEATKLNACRSAKAACRQSKPGRRRR
jgi:hypothetical protein